MAASDESDAALPDKVSNIQGLSDANKMSIFCWSYESRIRRSGPLLDFDRQPDID